MNAQRVCLLMCLAISVCRGEAHKGPQPFLLFSVTHRYDSEPLTGIGTLSEKQDFRHYDASGDRLDSVFMRAKLLTKSSTGFRFSWTVVQRKRGKEVVHFTTEEFVPWGSRKPLRSLPGYTVEIFYSPVPASQLDPFRSNQTMQPTTGRSEAALSFMKTRPLQVTFALASGG